jgi:arylsulfatase
MGSGNWELYNLATDPGETTDLSSKFPDIKEQLIKAWAEYAKQNNVHDHKGHYDSVYRKNF